MYTEKSHLFENWTTVCIIEFLYKHYRRRIIKARVPIYVVQFFVYFISIYLNEDWYKNKENPENSLGRFANFMAIINLILSFVQGSSVVVLGLEGGYTYFRSVWSHMDIIYTVFNALVSLAILADDFISQQSLRVIEGFLALLIVGKMLYFMQLFDQIAPLVTIIGKILKDIYWFMIVFIVI